MEGVSKWGVSINMNVCIRLKREENSVKQGLLLVGLGLGCLM